MERVFKQSISQLCCTGVMAKDSRREIRATESDDSMVAGCTHTGVEDAATSCTAVNSKGIVTPSDFNCCMACSGIRPLEVRVVTTSIQDVSVCKMSGT